MRRAVAQIPVFLLVLLVASNVAGQSNIPDGVFLRESNGTTWLVLHGKRVGVPIWTATDSEIAALPTTDQWAVLSVNDDGAMVGGVRPAWLPSQDAPQPAAPAPLTAAASPGATEGPWNLVVSEFTSYRPGAGSTSTYVYVVGLLENRSASPLAVKSIATSLIGGAGEILSSSGALNKPSLLKPGARAPFVALLQYAGAFADVRIQLETAAPDRFLLASVAQDLRTENVSAQAATPGSDARLAGQVVNVGAGAVTNARLLVAVFGRDGKVVDVQSAAAKLDMIQPGQSAPFEVSFGAWRLTDPSRYEIYAEATVAP